MQKLLLVLFALAVSAFAQERDFSKVEIKVQQVSGSIYMLSGAGGNIGVSVGEDGVLLIDDEFTPLAPKIQAAIKSISDKPIRWVLNTHYHGDHTGANQPMAQAGAEIIAHDNVRKRLTEGQTKGPAKGDPAPKDALPVITFDNSLGDVDPSRPGSSCR